MRINYRLVSMSKVMAFSDLWDAASSAAKAHNGFCYHHCCDIWTTKASKSKRSTHGKSIQWRNLLLTLDKNTEDKKQALLAKMTEEGWRLPAVLNEFCSVQPSPIFQQQAAFRPHIPDQPPQDLQAGIAHLNFINPDQPFSELATPSSTHYLT